MSTLRAPTSPKSSKSAKSDDPNGARDKSTPGQPVASNPAVVWPKDMAAPRGNGPTWGADPEGLRRE